MDLKGLVDMKTPSQQLNSDYTRNEEKIYVMIYRRYLYALSVFLVIIATIVILYLVPKKITNVYPHGGTHIYHVKRYKYIVKNIIIRHGSSKLLAADGSILIVRHFKNNKEISTTKNLVPSAVPTYIDALKDKDIELVSLCANSLITIGDKSLPELLKVLNDEDWYYRMAAAHIIGEIKPVKDVAIKGLVRAIKDRSYLVRATAAKELGKAGARNNSKKTNINILSILTHAINDDRSIVRLEACSSLVNIEQAGRVALNKVTSALSFLKFRLQSVDISSDRWWSRRKQTWERSTLSG